MNVVIVNRVSHEVIARYEIHRAGDGAVPPDETYFEEAWRRAVADASSKPTTGATTTFNCSGRKRSTRRRAKETSVTAHRAAGLLKVSLC